MVIKKTARLITSRPGASRLHVGRYASRVLKLSNLTLLCCLLASCAAQQIRQREAFVNHYSQGNYQAAYQEALSRGQIKENGASKDLLWSLNAGSSAFFTGQYGNAINIFDFAENQMKLNDTQGVAAEGATTTAALLINDNVRDYQFTSYDAVMLNTYKALAFLGDRKKDSARVEFNRADDRQRRAVEQFSKERQNLAKSLEAQSQQDPSVDYNSTLQAAVGNKDFVERMQAIDKWGSYGPFVNPLATYLHGLFFLHQKIGRAHV